MGISDLTTKLIGDKRRWRAYKARTAAFPTPYRTSIDGIERYLMYFGSISDGNTMMSMLEDLADLVEQSAVSGIPVRAIVSDDPVEFAETFLRNYTKGQWINKERERLIEAIARAEREEAGQ